MATKVIVLLAMAVTCSSAAAGDQVGIAIGNEYGFGVAAQTESRDVFVEGGAGVSPILYFATVDRLDSLGFVVKSEDTHFKVYLSISAGARLCVNLLGEEGENTLALKLGADYNTLIKMGFGAGVRYTIFGGKRRWALSGGFMFYPDADKELLEQLNEDEGPGLVPSSGSIAELERFRPYLSAIIFFGP